MTALALKADYANPRHARDIIDLLDVYARDPMGGGQELTSRVKQNLVQELAKRPTAFSVITYCDEVAVGLANCFEGFSTFRCAPLINIHDIVVKPAYRGRNISKLLLEKVEAIAREKGCCKLTLEVLEGNNAAQQAYKKFGFAAYQLDPQAGKALFWQKLLQDY